MHAMVPAAASSAHERHCRRLKRPRPLGDAQSCCDPSLRAPQLLLLMILQDLPGARSVRPLGGARQHSAANLAFATRLLKSAAMNKVYYALSKYEHAA